MAKGKKKKTGPAGPPTLSRAEADERIKSARGNLAVVVAHLREASMMYSEFDSKILISPEVGHMLRLRDLGSSFVFCRSTRASSSGTHYACANHGISHFTQSLFTSWALPHAPCSRSMPVHLHSALYCLHTSRTRLSFSLSVLSVLSLLCTSATAWPHPLAQPNSCRHVPASAPSLPLLTATFPLLSSHASSTTTKS